MRDYSRLAATAFSRDAVSGLTALVVGAGALGNEVIKNLALMGVGALWIVDRDRVEASNLTRSILYCFPEIDEHLERGTSKAELAAERARGINPDLRVQAFPTEIADLGLGVIRRADIVFSCVDNEMARLELSWSCLRLNRVMVDGGLGLINYSSGLVSIFPGSLGPCYLCRKGNDRRRELLQEMQGREDPCWRKEQELESRNAVTTTPTMASVTAALQVELGLRFLAGEEDREKGRSARISIHPRLELQSLVFNRSPACPLHEPEFQITDVVEFSERPSSQCRLEELLGQAGQGRAFLALDWPRVSRARCRSCGHEWEPWARKARFRRQACPLCASQDIAGTEIVSGIGADSPWRERTLEELGFPPGHIHQIAVGSDKDPSRFHVEVTGDVQTLDRPC